MLPVPKATPPVGAAYHLMVAPGVMVVAARFTVPVPHLVAGVVVVICGEFTFIYIVLEYSSLPDKSQITANLKYLLAAMTPLLAFDGSV